MLLNWPFSKRYRIRCPDGSIKTVYKNVDDAFPLYIPGWQGALNGSIRVPSFDAAALKGEYATRIQGLLYGLDELNRGLMMNFRGAYVAYLNDPCSYAAFFERQMESLLHEQRRLNELRVQIDGLISLAQLHPNSSDRLLPLFQNIVDKIGGQSVGPAAALEIEEARLLAIQLVRDNL